jgi:hypothetical protein
MYLKIKSRELKSFISLAVLRAGSIRKLSILIKIPKTTIHDYQQEKRLITEENLLVLENFLKTKLHSDFIIDKLSNNFRQSLGGVNCVKNQLCAGKMETQLKSARMILSKSGNDLKSWHKKMKKNNPLEYYTIQYNHFKKIGEYKYFTKKGEKVRNILEKETADFFFDKNIEYQYEPLINVGKRYFFPDFLIKNNTIIECTMWRGYDKAIKLAEKINILNKEYKVIVLVPEKLSNYYQRISKNLVLSYKELEKVMFK